MTIRYEQTQHVVVTMTRESGREQLAFSLQNRQRSQRTLSFVFSSLFSRHRRDASNARVETLERAPAQQ
jgi:hypothetical protein